MHQIIYFYHSTRRYFPDRFEHRGFEESGGGNDCTYLNILEQMFLREVFEKRET